MKAKELIKLLEQNGFELQKIKGSHHLYKHPNGKRTVVPLHNKEIPKSTLNAILKQSGLN